MPVAVRSRRGEGVLVSPHGPDPIGVDSPLPPGTIVVEFQSDAALDGALSLSLPLPSDDPEGVVHVTTSDSAAAPVPLPPFNGLDVPRMNLPRVPHDAVSLQSVLRGSPWGDLSYWTVFRDGQLVENRLGQLDDPDATAVRTYPNYLLASIQRIDLIASLEGGFLDGDVGLLMLLGGIGECPEWLESELALGLDMRAVEALATLWSAVLVGHQTLRQGS